MVRKHKQFKKHNIETRKIILNNLFEHQTI